jgi:hypothetical protein
MSTPSQIAANRRNGRVSNGPETPKGKAASAKNAMKHGLLSKDILLPNEDAEAFADLAEGLHAALRPEGRLEMELAERIVALTWRLRRVGRAEQAILAWRYFEVLGMTEVQEEKDAEMKADVLEQAKTLDLDPDAIEKLGLPDLLRPSHPAVERLRIAGGIAKAGLTDLVTFGEAFGNSQDPLAKLSRYETSMERSLYKALHELQRLQASRKGQPVPLPVAVDIDVTGLPELTVKQPPRVE